MEEHKELFRHIELIREAERQKHRNIKTQHALCRECKQYYDCLTRRAHNIPGLIIVKCDDFGPAVTVEEGA